MIDELMKTVFRLINSELKDLQGVVINGKSY